MKERGPPCRLAGVRTPNTPLAATSILRQRHTEFLAAIAGLEVIGRRMAIVQASEQNRQAFLKLLRYCELGRVSDGDYTMLYGFKVFSGYSTHPNIVTLLGKRQDGAEITTSAAGAYQIQKGTYDAAVDAGIVSDFSPSSQDKIALWLIATKGALLSIDQGQIGPAIQRLNRTWVSLPGGSHPKMSLDKAAALFNSLCRAGKGTCAMRMLLVLLPVLLSTKVSVAEVPLQAVVDRIKCGTSEFTVTSICNVTGPVRCERQSMTMTALHNWSLSKGVPLAGETDHTLATTLHGWACVTSPSGVKYLVLEYICDDRFPTCTDELQQQEFTQVVDLSGHNLDQGHNLVSRAHDAVMRQTGIENLLSSTGLRMQSLSFGRKAVNRSIRPD